MSHKVHPNDDEVRSIFGALQTVILSESHPPWAGDPRRPKPSRYAPCRSNQPLPRAFRPIDDWICNASKFSPRRKYFLFEGAHVYFRENLQYIAEKIANFDLQKNKNEILVIDDFSEKIVELVYSLNNIREFYDPKNHDKFYTIIQRVACAGEGRLYADIDGQDAVDKMEARRNVFHDSMEHLVGYKTAQAVETLQKMAVEGRGTIVVQEGSGTKRAFWRRDFVSALAHLWWNLYGSLPGSNPDNPFVAMVEAAWITTLECAEEHPVAPLFEYPIRVDDARLCQFKTMSWERTTRDVLAEMREFPQYKSKA